MIINQDTKVLETWQDEDGHIFAIVKHPSGQFEAMWEQDGELWPFGGTVGFTTAEFATIKEAQDFLLAGIVGQRENPDIWLQMVEVKPKR